MSSRLCLKLETRLDELERLTVAVEDLGQRNNWPSDFIFQVNLVLEEIGINIINHGSDNGLHEFEVTLTSDLKSLTIEIIDSGKPFNPLKDAPSPNLTAPLEERPIGGLGIHLICSLMDELHYQRDGGRNRLTLVKRRDS